MTINSPAIIIGRTSDDIVIGDQTPFIHDPPVLIHMGRCGICGQAAVIDPEANLYQQHLWIHNNKPCPGFDIGKLLNRSTNQVAP
jgi:hypothetical protein